MYQMNGKLIIISALLSRWEIYYHPGENGMHFHLLFQRRFHSQKKRMYLNSLSEYILILIRWLICGLNYLTSIPEMIIYWFYGWLKVFGGYFLLCVIKVDLKSFCRWYSHAYENSHGIFKTFHSLRPKRTKTH